MCIHLLKMHTYEFIRPRRPNTISIRHLNVLCEGCCTSTRTTLIEKVNVLQCNCLTCLPKICMVMEQSKCSHGVIVSTNGCLPVRALQFGREFPAMMARIGSSTLVTLVRMSCSDYGRMGNNIGIYPIFITNIKTISTISANHFPTHRRVRFD